MKISNLNRIKPKDLIVFDLDGTLVRTKAPMDSEMSELMTKLLSLKKVAIIGGGKYALFQRLLLHRLKSPKTQLTKLFLFPTTSTLYYRYHDGWKKIYEIQLTPPQRAQIKKAFAETFKELGYKHPKKTYGKIIEDRGTQVTFSVFGQEIVKALGERGILMKEDWLKNNYKLKMKIAAHLAKKLPNLEVRAAGFTSIDVTKKGIDKAYGIYQIQKYLKVPIKKMLFIGDAIHPAGNDYAIVRTGVDYIPVKDPEETKRIIKKLI